MRGRDALAIRPSKGGCYNPPYACPARPGGREWATEVTSEVSTPRLVLVSEQTERFPNNPCRDGGGLGSLGVWNEQHKLNQSLSAHRADAHPQHALMVMVAVDGVPLNIRTPSP